jgi:hypothetical protein
MMRSTAAATSPDACAVTVRFRDVLCWSTGQEKSARWYITNNNPADSGLFVKWRSRFTGCGLTSPVTSPFFLLPAGNQSLIVSPRVADDEGCVVQFEVEIYPCDFDSECDAICTLTGAHQFDEFDCLL